MVWHVEDDFNGGALGERVIGQEYTSGYSRPYPEGVVPNTVLDTVQNMQSIHGAVFVAGRNGGQGIAAKPPPSSWNQVQFIKYVNGFDAWVNVDFGPDPMTGDLVAQGWFKVDGGGRGFTMMRLTGYDLASHQIVDYGVDGLYSEYDTDNYALNLFAVPNPYGTQPGNCQVVWRAADWAGVNGSYNVMEEQWCTIPYGEWLHCELRYGSTGMIQCIVTTEAGAVVMDTGAVQGIGGWTPADVIIASPYDPPMTNYPMPSTITWDWFEVTIEEQPAIAGDSIIVRRRFT